jgi:nitric oxide reductase subunit B
MHQHHLIKHHQEFKHAYTYIIGAVFWNFVGAGVFGGSRSTPLINYYEHSTFLTLNHAHTALFGAFGLLAIGLIYFCLRYATADRAPFSDSLGLAAFWLYNARLILWIALNFFPVGWPQLDALFQHGLAYVRSLEFYDTTVLWQWLRFLGDALCRRRLLMAFDFIVKLTPLFPNIPARYAERRAARPAS